MANAQNGKKQAPIYKVINLFFSSNFYCYLIHFTIYNSITTIQRNAEDKLYNFKTNRL